jgi:hypothetical protein
MASAGERPIANVGAARLDLLGAYRLLQENKRKLLLDFLGFPWILSFESRLINGLRGINGAKNFLGGLSLRDASGNRG